MANFIITTIFWIIAIYGLIEIIKNIYYICTYTNLRANGIYLIIAVKNQEDKIEGFLRSILFRLIYGKEEAIKDIIVTDLNSNDDTKVILERMNKDYDYIKFANWKDCKNIIDNIEEVSINF